MSYVWQKVANDWNTLTASQKENLFTGTNYIKPTMSQLVGLGAPFKIAAFNGNSSALTTFLEAVPDDKLFVPNSLFGGTFDSIDSISPKVNIYGGDVSLAHFNIDYSDVVTGLNWVQVGTMPINTTITKFGVGSLEFDGTSYIYAPNKREDFNFENKDFSIEMWVYPTDNTVRQSLFSFSSEFHGVAVDMFYNGTNNVNMWYSSNGTSWDIADANTTTSNGKGIDNMITINDWNHIAFTRNGKYIVLYVNGLVSSSIELDPSLNISMYFDDTDLFFIGASYSGGNLFKGYIDEVRIAKGMTHYSSTFTPESSEFSSIVNMPTLKFMLTKDLSNYYTFDESLVTKTSVTTVVDKTVISMDGSDDRIVIPASVLGGEREFTVEVDISTTSISSGSSYYNNPAIFGFYISGNADADFGVQVKNGYLCWFSGLTSGSVDKYGVTNKFIADGNKHNIAVICDGVLFDIYVDGKRVARTTSENISLASHDIYIGYTNAYSAMKIFEVRLWNLARFYKYLGKKIDVTSYGLKAWYLPENLTGTTLYDASNEGNDASVDGSPVTATESITETEVIETSGFVPLTTLSATEVINTGITAETLASISESQWDLFFSGSGGDAGIGIGFAISQDLTLQEAGVDNMTIYVDMKGEWASAHKGVDYEYGYPNNNLLRVQLLTDGDYKINYLSPSGSGGSTPSGSRGGATNWEPNTDYQEGDIILYSGTMYVADNDFTSGAMFSDSNLTSYGGIPLTASQINAIVNSF